MSKDGRGGGCPALRAALRRPKLWLLGLALWAAAYFGWSRRQRLFRPRAEVLADLAQVLPAPAGFWDTVVFGPGGGAGANVWNYTNKTQSRLVRYVRRQNFTSLLDVACNQGFVLERLAEARPEAKFYGTDISAVMVNATRQRCRDCVVAQFDLGALQEPSFTGIGGAFPASFDVVIVSDVLYFMHWGGVPPLLWKSGWLPEIAYAAPLQAWWHHLTRLANQEVIFSEHQRNEGIRRLLLSLGADYDARARVYRAPGRAGAPAAPAPGPAALWLSRRIVPTVLALLTVTCCLGAARLLRAACAAAGCGAPCCWGKRRL